MADSREFSRIYMRIFLVEAAYWIISIGMVFINESVLKDKILTDDLTVFVTIFQILTSLIILITLNHITKCYLEPDLHRTGRVQISKHQAGDTDHTKPLISNESDEEEDILFVAYSDKKPNDQAPIKTGNESENDLAIVKSSVNANGTIVQEKIFSSVMSEHSDRSSSEGGLKQLFIINIPQRINLETCKIVFPLSILYVGMLLLNNFCLKNVGVAFYFVSRSLTTVFNVIFTYFLINESVSRGALACCGFIVLGFILGVDQESVIGSFSVIGVFFGVASSLFTSLFSIYTKKILAKLDKNIWVLVLYNNINAIVLCAPLLIVHGDIQALISERLVDPSFWVLLSISGVMAFFISIVTNASIKYTSPLTHNISGTAKACFQTVIAVLIEPSDHRSPLWWLSNITILVASAMYSRVKQLEMERKTSASAVSQMMSENGADKLPFDKNQDSKDMNMNSCDGLQEEKIVLESSGRDSSSSGFSEKLLGADSQTGLLDARAEFLSVKFQSPQ